MCRNDAVSVKSLCRFLELALGFLNLSLGQRQLRSSVLLCARVDVLFEPVVLSHHVMGKAFELLLLAQDGFFGPALVVTCVGQLLDAFLDAVRVGLNLVIGGVSHFAVQRLPPPVTLGRVIDDLDLDIVVC